MSCNSRSRQATSCCPDAPVRHGRYLVGWALPNPSTEHGSRLVMSQRTPPASCAPLKIYHIEGSCSVHLPTRCHLRSWHCQQLDQAFSEIGTIHPGSRCSPYGSGKRSHQRNGTASTHCCIGLKRLVPWSSPTCKIHEFSHEKWWFSIVMWLFTKG